MNVLKAGEVLEAVVSKPVMIEDLERMEILSPSGDQIGKVGRFKNLIQHVECDLVIFDQLKNIFFIQMCLLYISINPTLFPFFLNINFHLFF